MSTQMEIKSIQERLDRIEETLESKEVDKIFTIGQLAGFLNCSMATIYRKVSKGELPHMKRNNRLYFSKIEIIKYLKEGK